MDVFRPTCIITNSSSLSPLSDVHMIKSILYSSQAAPVPKITHQQAALPLSDSLTAQMTQRLFLLATLSL